MPPAPRVLPGVGPALRDLAARRLARSYIVILLATALGIVELGLGPLAGLDTRAALWIVAGAPVAAACLLGLGWTGVRRGAGDVPAPWMTVASGAGFLPSLWGLYLLALPGLRRLATESGALAWILGLAWAVLGLRVMLDTVRVREVGRLGHFMAIPAPEEEEG